MSGVGAGVLLLLEADRTIQKRNAVVPGSYAVYEALLEVMMGHTVCC